MIDEVIARLADVSALKLVAGAAAFQVAAESNPTAVPAAFVLLLSETPGPNQLDGPGIEQRVQVAIGVVLVTRNAADAKGAAVGTDMASLRQAVKAALYGWRPDSAAEGLERGPSALLAFKDGHQWWQDAYATAYYERSY